eukprot:CAMPEP_0117850614 /NCGR_PEP_ID=MMETSP0949-20121206/21794_1 /TAXON_ID=44440 /ORGANISM="Chattonella subsalsa, Strain CCMP2191" /LENGTH=79 /DNA_ID=CAMNT_0005698045 /DNA_START=62 /DNA_END=301 /DNA_ORIENTATION=-
MTPFRAPLEVEPDDNESYDGDDPTLWFEQLQDQVFPDEEENVVFEKCPGKLQAKGTRPSRCVENSKQKEQDPHAAKKLI